MSDGIYAVFAVGFTGSYTAETLSFQGRFASQEIAEASGLIRWQKDHPKAKQPPIVTALGPYAFIEDTRP